MRFEKPPLTIGEQVELLLSRGMTGDTACISNRLVMANYYRLSGYWYPFPSNCADRREETLPPRGHACASDNWLQQSDLSSDSGTCETRAICRRRSPL